jgi:hypothetical protein
MALMRAHDDARLRMILREEKYFAACAPTLER